MTAEEQIADLEAQRDALARRVKDLVEREAVLASDDEMGVAVVNAPYFPTIEEIFDWIEQHGDVERVVMQRDDDGQVRASAVVRVCR